MLRAARQQQGLHIAALAAAIKVTPAKLEALESGRYHELLDATFTRALAQAVCRVLKIDPAPVLAQLPSTPADALGRVDGGLNTPYRERPGRAAPADWAPWRHPVLWLVAVLLAAAAAFVLVPSVKLHQSAPAPAAADGLPPPVMPALVEGAAPSATQAAPTESAGGASAAGLQTPPSAVPVASMPQVGAAAASTPVTTADTPNNVNVAAVALTPTAANVAELRAVQASWVQAVDGRGQTLLARLVPAGERVELKVTPPLRLRIGNARGTELKFRGQTVDLVTASRDNIVNLTLP